MSSNWKKEMYLISEGHTPTRNRSDGSDVSTTHGRFDAWDDEWKNDDSAFHGHSNLGRQAIKRTHAHAGHGRGRDDGFAAGAGAGNHFVSDYSDGMNAQGRSGKRRGGM